jgi:hypothetical protein
VPGELSGTVERVATGEKHRFHGLQGLVSLIVELIVPTEARRHPARRGPTRAT